LLGPHDGTVATEEEEGADEGVDAPLAGGGPRDAAEFEEREEQRAGDEEARRGYEEGRHRFDGDADAEIGAAPDEVDRGEGGDDGGARRCGRGHDDGAHDWPLASSPRVRRADSMGSVHGRPQFMRRQFL